jgi:hypothetical protein
VESRAKEIIKFKSVRRLGLFDGKIIEVDVISKEVGFLACSVVQRQVESYVARKASREAVFRADVVALHSPWAVVSSTEVEEGWRQACCCSL